MVVSKTLLASLALVVLSFETANGALGIDVSTVTSEDSWSCMMSAGYSYAIVRGYLSYGAVDTNVIDTLENARSAGIEYRDIYVFPCRGLDATTQMDEFADYLEANNYYSGVDYQYAWLDLESNPKTECYWSSYSATSNCEYVQELTDALEARGIAVGFYSSYYNWELIFDSVSSCTDFNSYPLWYAHYDDDASFDSWNTLNFGGWDTPSMKQYVGDDVLCSTGVDFNYAPASFFTSYYSGGTDADCDNPQTAGDVPVTFPSASITSVESCSSNYEDPNNMGVYLFSESGSGSTTYLSDNFQVSEFASPDGDDYFRLSPYLVECVQAVRTDIAEALYIKEAYRTVSYNTDVNGATLSRHMSGTAASIYAGSASLLTVAESSICNCWEIFENAGYSIGLGLAEDYVHVDMRESYSYWVETGASYDSSEWNSYISDIYSSCVDGTESFDTDTNGNNNDDDNTNDDGTIKFPNVNLTPTSSSSSDYDDPNDSGTSLFSGSDAGTSTYLSDNFQVSEFMCNDGSDGFRLAPELVECLQAVREELGISININSGYRTVSYNSYVGGATYSRHQSGTAADIQQYSTDIFTFADSVICNCRSIFIANGQEIGIGLGASYLHVDMRPYYSYWVYSGASLSSSSWNSYISSTYSSCPSYVTASGYEIGTQTLQSIADQDETLVENDDVNEDLTRDDIDDEEEVITNDESSNGGNNNSNDDGFFSQWWGILIIVLIVVAVLGVVGFIACKKCKSMMDEKNTYDQYSSGYTKVEEQS